MSGLTGDHEDPAWQAPRPQVVWIVAFCLVIDAPPAGWALPPHWHRNEAETIHIVEGEFEIDVDGKRFVLSAGQPHGSLRAQGPFSRRTHVHSRRSGDESSCTEGSRNCPS
jgi:hypothetical protein